MRRLRTITKVHPNKMAKTSSKATAKSKSSATLPVENTRRTTKKTATASKTRIPARAKIAQPKTKSVKPAAAKAAPKKAAAAKPAVAKKPAASKAAKPATAKATKPAAVKAAKSAPAKTKKPAAAKTVKAVAEKAKKPAATKSAKPATAKTAKAPAKAKKPAKATATKPATDVKPKAKAKAKRKPATTAAARAAAKKAAAAKPMPDKLVRRVRPVLVRGKTAIKEIVKAAPKPKPRAKKRMPSAMHGFAVGDFVVYPSHGVGRINTIEEHELGDLVLQVFAVVFDKEKMTLRVPVNKAASSGMRRLSSQDTMDAAITTLRGRARTRRVMWSRRAQEYEAKLNSGDPISIAEVVRDLHRSGGQPDQSYSERQMYEAALERSKNDPGALNNHCYLLTLMGRAGEAIGYCEQAVVGMPDEPAVLHSYAAVLAAMGRCDEAEDNRRRAAELHPSIVEYQTPLVCDAPAP